MKIELRPDVIGDSKKFEFIYTGFIIGGSLTQQKGMIVLRREVQVLGKLEAISKESDPPKTFFGNEILRELTGGVLELSTPEKEMLTSYMANVPWTSGKPVRDVLEILDWIETL